MSDAIISLIRTYAAIWVAAGGTWLADKGIDLPVDPATVVVTAVAGSAYYALARVLESRWPWFGVLLGSAKSPQYVKQASGRTALPRM